MCLQSHLLLIIPQKHCYFRSLAPRQAIMPPTEEDLAWLRSTFHPIPKPRLPDDCVEYCLYIFNSDIDPSNASETRLRLREVQKQASELQKEWLKDYIWQRQGFGLEMVTEDGEVGFLEHDGAVGS